MSISYKCQLCDSTDADVTKTSDAKSNEKINIAFCKKCGLVQLKNIPSDDELKIYYSHNYRLDYKKTYHPTIK